MVEGISSQKQQLVQKNSSKFTINLNELNPGKLSLLTKQFKSVINAMDSGSLGLTEYFRNGNSIFHERTSISLSQRVKELTVYE